MITTLLPDAAAWIRDVVLPAAYRRNTVDPALCPCQWGPSGHCQNGDHERCPRTEGWHRHGQADPDTYITDARGMPAAGAEVWRSGTACRWLCPCPCHTTVTPLFPMPARAPRRLSRSGGNGHVRIASTDSTLADDPQPALFGA